MMECDFTWRDRTRIEGTPLDHRCRCRRPPGHADEHLCICTPINWFTFETVAREKEAFRGRS